MKIRIFGGIASGKSTLATELGKKLHIPVYSTDDFVYTKDFKRRSEKERTKLIHTKLKESWIVEGVHFAKWCEKTYAEADKIIILDIPKRVLAKRIITRTFKREKKHYKNKYFDTIRLIWMMFRDTNKEMKEYKRIAKNKKIILKNNNASISQLHP